VHTVQYSTYTRGQMDATAAAVAVAVVSDSSNERFSGDTIRGGGGGRAGGAEGAGQTATQARTWLVCDDGACA
jgi:hypothetical protein